MTEKPKRPQQVFTLLVQVGRKDGDGLPAGSTGAGLLCYASGVDEAEAVRETVAILKQAETIFMRDLPFLPLLYYGSLSLVSDKLKGWEDNIQNVHASRWMEIVQ